VVVSTANKNGRLDLAAALGPHLNFIALLVCGPALAVAVSAWLGGDYLLFAGAIFVLITPLLLIVRLTVLEERTWWREFYREMNDPLQMAVFDWDSFESQFWAHVERLH
jgi:hypothetical protein